MIWFKFDKKDELIKLLKGTKSEFKFDPNSVKFRLLSSIEHTKMSPNIHRFKFARVMKYSAGFAGFVLLIAGTFAFASNATPGDRLFTLNKVGEKVILSLPLPVEQKAKIEAYIVTNRLEALDKVQVQSTKASDTQTNTKLDTKKLQTIKESDESLTSAINNITEKKKQLEAKGKLKSAEQLEIVLDELQSKAEKRESTIKDLEDKTTDQEIKAKIEVHLNQIRSSRKKAQDQIRRYQSEKRDTEKTQDRNDNDEEDRSED